MSPGDESKKLGASDGTTRRFLEASLGGDITRGFDVDSLYCQVDDGKVTWLIIEMLKCDSVPPEKSHPKYYWKGDSGFVSGTPKKSNKRKFLSLWALCKSLQNRSVDARLLLVNFRDEHSKVKLMSVLDMSEDIITVKESPAMTFQEWSDWFRRLNKSKKGSTWDALEVLKAEESS